MDSSPYTITIFVILIGLCYGDGVLPNLHYGAVEGKVIFPPNLAPTNQPHFIIIWAVNGSTTILTQKINQLIEVTAAYENRVSLNVSTGSLELRTLTMKDSGGYSVTITPAIGPTLLGTTTLQVLEKVSGTRINPSSQSITEGMSVNLTCTAAGSDVTREWMKDGGPLSPSNRVSFSGDNKTVSIHPVNRNDDGVYLCRVRNPVSSEEATYSMTVNYGPDRVTIQGPLEIEVGQKLTLTCLTDSKPTANYTWVLNGTYQLGQSHVLTIEKIHYNNSGAYTCTASNGVTGHSKNAVHTLNVKAEGSLRQGGLSGGAIAGIVIAVLVLVGVVAGLIVYFIKTKDLFKTTSSHGRSATGPGPGNSSRATDQELNYADISQFHKKDGGSVQIGNVASRVDSSSSADVRVNGNQPTYKPHLQDAKRPDPDPPSIYSDVRNN